MAWLVTACGVVATIQGVAWVSHATAGRRALGVVLAAVGTLALAGGLVQGVVPAFLGG